MILSQSVLKRLSNEIQVSHKALSKLTTTTKSDYDLVITHESKLFDVEVKSESCDSDHFHNEDDDKTEIEYRPDQHETITNTADCEIDNFGDNIENTNDIDVFNCNDDRKDSKNSVPKLEAIKTECDVGLIDVGNNGRDPQVPAKKISRKGQCQIRKYKVIKYSELNRADLMKYVDVTRAEPREIKNWINEERSKPKFVAGTYKCRYCFMVFGMERSFLKHRAYRHREDGDNVFCDICGRGFLTKVSLSLHVRSHDHKYTCKLCNAQFYTQPRMTRHLQKHSTRFQCPKCPLIFEWQRDFYHHYKALHAYYKCDYCGSSKVSKKDLESHIMRHTTKYCKICDIHFKNFHNYTYHNKMKHVKSESDNTYCVECDMKFQNVLQYKRHISSSVKHVGSKKEQYPCPVCNKVYAKKLTMKYHLQYYHLEKSQFRCEKCDRYFLNPFRLRQHIARIHDKIAPPKNKFCDICFRGFSTNRILTNHRRTHTGERPYQCEFCTSTFAQRTALMTHRRTQHKMFDKPVAVNP